MNNPILRSAILSLLSFIPTVAFAQESEAICAAGAQCCINPENAFAKIALVLVPIVVLFVVGFFVSGAWGKKAASNGVPTVPHQRAGWALGGLFGALVFSGMSVLLTVPSTSGSCTLPSGYLPIVIILLALTFVFLVITKVQAK